MRDDGKSVFELPYKRPFRILSRSDKIFPPDLGNRLDVVSIDRLSPHVFLMTYYHDNCDVSDRVSMPECAERYIVRRRHKNMNDKSETIK